MRALRGARVVPVVQAHASPDEDGVRDEAPSRIRSRSSGASGAEAAAQSPARRRRSSPARRQNRRQSRRRLRKLPGRPESRRSRACDAVKPASMAEFTSTTKFRGDHHDYNTTARGAMPLASSADNVSCLIFFGIPSCAPPPVCVWSERGITPRIRQRRCSAFAMPSTMAKCRPGSIGRFLIQATLETQYRNRSSRRSAIRKTGA